MPPRAGGHQLRARAFILAQVKSLGGAANSLSDDGLVFALVPSACCCSASLACILPAIE